MKRGRPKGYSPYTEISYEDLSDYVGKKTLVKVCKSWLEDLVEATQANSFVYQEPMKNETKHSIQQTPLQQYEQPKIEYELTTFE
tara:strand:+ start:827 stop:1081 length:255 start_codon:yes stop_codon:yes gene_type:complete